MFFILSLVSTPLLPFPSGHSWKSPSFSLDSSVLILSSLVLLFPKKTMLALDFNPINLYPWKDVSHLNLLVGLLLEVPRHSWRETLCGLRHRSSLEISYEDVHSRCTLSSQLP